MLRLLAFSMMGFAVLALPGSEVPKAMTSYMASPMGKEFEASPMGKDFEAMAAQKASMKKRESRLRRVTKRCEGFEMKKRSIPKSEKFARSRLVRKMRRYNCVEVIRQAERAEAKMKELKELMKEEKKTMKDLEKSRHQEERNVQKPSAFYKPGKEIDEEM